MTNQQVTDADIEDFKLDMGASGIGLSGWNNDQIAIAIAAAWEVMRKKHADTLADAVKESLNVAPVAFVEFSKSAAGDAIVHVEGKHGVAVRHVSLDANFAQLATAAVRQLSAQVRQ